MNTVNAATGFSPFALKSGHSPRLIPPLVDALAPDLETETRPTAPAPTSDREDTMHTVMEQLTTDLLEARDLLTAAKISQAHHANKDRAPDCEFGVHSGTATVVNPSVLSSTYMREISGK
jgi:hypothetical protein